LRYILSVSDLHLSCQSTSKNNSLDLNCLDTQKAPYSTRGQATYYFLLYYEEHSTGRLSCSSSSTEPTCSHLRRTNLELIDRDDTKSVADGTSRLVVPLRLKLCVKSLPNWRSFTTNKRSGRRFSPPHKVNRIAHFNHQPFLPTLPLMPSSASQATSPSSNGSSYLPHPYLSTTQVSSIESWKQSLSTSSESEAARKSSADSDANVQAYIQLKMAMLSRKTSA
jgi:hypothetical protein